MGLYTSHYPLTNLARNLFFAFVRLYLRPHAIGWEHLPGEGPFILAANHASHADTAVLFSLFPRSLRQHVVAAAAHDYFFDQGFRQGVARIFFNAVPVDREATDEEDPLRYVIRALAEGYGLLIYPEGTRRQDGAIGPFRRGIGRLIAEFPGLPVIPVYLNATAKVLPKGKTIPRPYSVGVWLGLPLYLQAQRDDRASWQAATEMVRTAVLELKAQARQNF